MSTDPSQIACAKTGAIQDGFSVTVEVLYEQDYDVAMKTEDLRDLDWKILGYRVW